nr:MAG TPA: hypothetical protein [Bacteriophage sp.]DAZ41776.1 MAG TPA: hypothetical protein [Caudoviricetes sp.]
MICVLQILHISLQYRKTNICCTDVRHTYKLFTL